MRLLFEERLRAIRNGPATRLLAVGVARGMRVVDLGAGKGYYALAAAEIVGPEGKVYAVEPDRHRAEVVEARVSSSGLANLLVLATGAEELAEIPEATVDLALSMNSMHHFRDRAAVFSEVKRILKPGGRFYVRDMVKGWLNLHGTRKEEIADMPGPGYSGRKVSVGRLTLDATFTK